MNIADLVPPILARLLARILRRPTTFPDFATAAAACHTPSGYEDAELVAVVLAKTRRLRDELKHGLCHLNPSQAQMLFALARVLSDTSGQSLCVLDFGGACGAHCLTARTAFPAVEFRWVVVETPAMAAAGAALADAGLIFADSLAGAPSADLVLSSGAIQYTPDPLAALAAIARHGAPWLYLSRLGLRSALTPLVSIQRSRLSANGYGPLPPGFADRDLDYPATFMPRTEAESLVETHYEVVAEFAESPSMYRVGVEDVPGVGWLARRR